MAPTVIHFQIQTPPVTYPPPTIIYYHILSLTITLCRSIILIQYHNSTQYRYGTRYRNSTQYPISDGVTSCHSVTCHSVTHCHTIRSQKYPISYTVRYYYPITYSICHSKYRAKLSRINLTHVKAKAYGLLEA